MSDFTPRNTLEEVLLAASTGAADPGAFLDALRDSSILVPATQEKGQEEVSFPAIDHEGGKYVPLYTSEAQAALGAPQHRGWLQTSGGELADMLPDGTGIAVNPGGQLGLALPADAVGALKGPGQLRFPEGTKLRIGVPANEPPELRQAIAGWASSQPGLRAVHRALVQPEGQEESTLVLGLEVEPGTDGEAIVDAAVHNLPGVGAIVMSPGATDPLTTFMREQDDPIYRA